MKASRRYLTGRFNLANVDYEGDDTYTITVRRYGHKVIRFRVKDLYQPTQHIIEDEEDDEVE